MGGFPTGTVSLLFTDIEGSTRLLHELGDRYAEVLAEHRRLLREAFAHHRGFEVDTQGDAFFVAFPTAPGALAAAAEALAGLERGPIHVRMGLHTGTPHVGEEGYVGVDVHRAARIAAAGHGGQVLVSAATAALLGPDGLRDLGEHRLKDLSAPERIFQLGDDEFPPLASLHQTNLPVPATPFLGRECASREELDALGRRERRHRVGLLALDLKERPTRHEHAQVRARREQLGHVPRCRDQVLEVVEQQQQPLVRNVIGQAVLRPHRLPRLVEHEGRVVKRGESHPEDAVGVRVRRVACCLAGQARFPGSSRATQGDDARSVTLEQRPDLCELSLPAKERRRRHGQVRLIERP